jgi:hydroxyacylglutathione hydrolase
VEVKMTEAKYEVIKISNNSWRIEDSMVRLFLFEGADRALLVDTGFGTGNIKKIIEGITAKPIMLVNTHADPDHTGCNALFEKAFMHPSEYPYYFENRSIDAAVSPLWDKDIIELGSRRFEVLLIPGHTAGSIALLDRANRILISGDSISAAPIFMFGKMRSLPAYIHSMERLKKMINSFDIIYPSHGPFPIVPELIEKLIAGAGKLMRGELQWEDPPFELPAKMYSSGDVAFFY